MLNYEYEYFKVFFIFYTDLVRLFIYTRTTGIYTLIPANLVRVG